jgi:hypothetical protein
MRLHIFLGLTLIGFSFLVCAASAKTSTGTIGESAQITAGNSVSAYLIDGTLVTTSKVYPQAPLLRVGFELQSSWHLVTHTNWDKRHRMLTIDF